MPVGTVGTVKGITPAQLKDAHAQMILGNTYHLHIRPGEDIVSKAGGLHGFMNWEQPILTDSGGFQVFSLAKMRKISEEGVKFRSPKDGQIINMTPEHSIHIQNALGADVIMAFDECPPATATREEVITATDRTYRWLKTLYGCPPEARYPSSFLVLCKGEFFKIYATKPPMIWQG